MLDGLGGRAVDAPEELAHVAEAAGYGDDERVRAGGDGHLHVGVVLKPLEVRALVPVAQLVLALCCRRRTRS